MRAAGTYRELSLHPDALQDVRDVSIERVGPNLIRVDVSDGLIHGFTVAQAIALREILTKHPEILA